jgi:methylenetetrahydrofolate--tRNA-(uracil-5-)-methyltransferase
MKANFGILPELSERVKNKRDRYSAYSERALHDLETSIANLQDSIPNPVL